jgi:hypothetical protein
MDFKPPISRYEWLKNAPNRIPYHFSKKKNSFFDFVFFLIFALYLPKTLSTHPFFDHFYAKSAHSDPKTTSKLPISRYEWLKNGPQSRRPGPDISARRRAAPGAGRAGGGGRGVRGAWGGVQGAFWGGFGGFFDRKSGVFDAKKCKFDRKWW